MATTDNEEGWISVDKKLPPDGVVVDTVIMGPPRRNQQTLMRQGRLWFVPSGSMYVYYEPTHWRSVNS